MTPLSVRMAEVLVALAFIAFLFSFLSFDKTLSSDRESEDTTTVR